VRCFADVVVSLRGIEGVSGTTQNRRRTYHHRRREFFTQVIPVAEVSTLLPPGDYVYPFCLPLRSDLPGSFQISNYLIKGWIVDLYDVSAFIAYRLSAKLRVKGTLVADLEASCLVTVVPRPPSLQLRSLSASVSRHVRFMGIFPRSRCSLTVSINQNVFVGGTILHVNYSVRNESSAPVSSIAISIFEDISVKPYMLDSLPRSSSNRVYGLLSGESRDDEAVIELVYNSTGQPLRRTTKAHFTEWSYCLFVRCRFAMSTSVHVELPIVIV